MATAKKTVAKTPAKKTVEKKTAAPKAETKAKPDNELPGNSEGRLSVEEIAAECIAGKWGTGRERDVKLITHNYDPLEINKEVAKQLSER